MVRSKQVGRRLAALSALGSSLALAVAANAMAYPVTPEGEPLYVEAVATPPEYVTRTQAVPVTSTDVRGNAVATLRKSSSGGAGSDAIGIAAASSLAALVVLAAGAAHVRYRSRSASGAR